MLTYLDNAQVAQKPIAALHRGLKTQKERKGREIVPPTLYAL